MNIYNFQIITAPLSPYRLNILACSIIYIVVSTHKDKKRLINVIKGGGSHLEKGSFYLVIYYYRSINILDIEQSKCNRTLYINI